MIPYIIGAILVIITLLIIGLILRKRIYDAVDRHERWKMDIMNRNTASELAKIKGLNLAGETQEKFESWKEQWEVILTKELPGVEELLFEAEDAADRYRFPTANKIVHKIEKYLNTIEDEITQMLDELDDLLLSEESSRKEIENLKPLAVKLHKQLVDNRDDYGKAQTRFIEEINLVQEKFLTYDELAEFGNYIKAKTLVDEITLELEVLKDKIKKYPKVLDLCTNHLPQELKDLAAGITDMENDGYYVDHLGFKENIEKYRERLKDAKESLENGALPEIEIVVAEMAEQIKEMYDELEEEAIAKNYIDNHISSYQDEHASLEVSFSETQEEVDILRKSYYFDEKEMEKYLQMEKSITSFQKELVEVVEKNDENESSYSELQNEIQSGFERIEKLQEKHNEFKNKIRSLRKEELDAREKLSNLNHQVKNQKRKLSKNNLPGVPDFIWSSLNESTKKNTHVLNALEKQPLDMSEVQQALAESDISIKETDDQIDVMLDQVYLTEQVIQYANRYRSRDPILAAKLSEAERLFRSYEYELSLEHAAEAIEDVEPGALKVIEGNQASLLS